MKFPVFFSMSLFLALVLGVSLFLRTYRINQNLFFYNDQGTDGRRINRLLKEKHILLVGTETSIGPQVRIGPIFYYLITPFYFLGGGSPIPAALFLIILSVLSLYLVYRFARETFGPETAWLCLVLMSFSYYLVLFSRWLSNPNPIIFLSILLLFSMKKIMEGRAIYWWLISAFLVGLSFHFQAASAFFYVFVFGIFAVWQRKKGLNPKIMVAMLFVFFLTFVPQIIYDVRNNHVISRGLTKYIFEEGSFDLFEEKLYTSREAFFLRVFRHLFFPDEGMAATYFLFGLISVAIVNLKLFWKNPYYKLLLLFLAVPVAGIYLFRQFVIGYYFSGFFVPIFILVAFALASATSHRLGKIFTLLFVGAFIAVNAFHLFSYLTKDIEAKELVSFKNQKEAVLWIAERSDKYDVDLRVFIPDKITNFIDGTDGYKYLLLIYGKRLAVDYVECKEGQGRRQDDVPIDGDYSFFVLKEYDPFIQRFKSWEICENLDKSSILESENFGGITVEKRVGKANE